LLTKRAVNSAFETTLTEGVRVERALFLSLFGTADQIEGMAAFVEKRKPVFEREQAGVSRGDRFLDSASADA